MPLLVDGTTGGEGAKGVKQPGIGVPGDEGPEESASLSLRHQGHFAMLILRGLSQFSFHEKVTVPPGNVDSLGLDELAVPRGAL